MLKLNKEEVHFLVTAEMKKEVADFLEAVDAKIAPVLEYIKENQVERVCFIGCGSSSAAGSTAKYLADKYTTLTVNAYTGWEFVDSMPVYGDRKTLAVFISQSGTTEEIVEGLRKARNQGFMTFFPEIRSVYGIIILLDLHLGIILHGIHAVHILFFTD